MPIKEMRIGEILTNQVAAEAILDREEELIGYKKEVPQAITTLYGYISFATTAPLQKVLQIHYLLR